MRFERAEHPLDIVLEHTRARCQQGDAFAFINEVWSGWW